jgi:hypothetical protein
MHDTMVKFAKTHPGFKVSVYYKYHTCQYEVCIDGGDRILTFVFDESFFENSMDYILNEMSLRLKDIEKEDFNGK